MFTHMRVLRAVLIFFAIALALYFMVMARDLLIPLVLALFFWYLISTLTVSFSELSVRGRHLPKNLAFVLALLTIGAVSGFLANLITDNISQVVKAAPTYEENFERVVSSAMEMLDIEERPSVGPLFRDVDLARIVRQSAAALASLVGDAGLTVIYLVFIFVEEKHFRKKMEALFPDPKRRAEMRAILARIEEDTRTYVGLKTLVSLLTAVPSYLIMKYVALDYAEFWAVLIFVLNFIPNIGSLIATLMPSLLALVQYSTYRPFFIVAGGVMAVQLFVANIIEPRIMGNTLNLSPLVIILSLVVWGTLWGIAGMFLCVPIMVILMIILSHFPKTRPVAILLSRDGRTTDSPAVT